MKCEKCSMEATHIEKDLDGIDHNFCEHHSLDLEKKSEFKKLIPLFFVFSFIILFSSIRQFTVGINLMMFMMDFMGLFFLVFGLFKLVDLRGFVDGFQSYDVVARKFRFFGYLYPFFEIIIGVLYLAGYMSVWQNIFVLILSGLGLFSVLNSLMKKSKIKCVCLGTVFDLPMTWVTFFENFLMFVMAVLMLLLN